MLAGFDEIYRLNNSQICFIIMKKSLRSNSGWKDIIRLLNSTKMTFLTSEIKRGIGLNVNHFFYKYYSFLTFETGSLCTFQFLVSLYIAFSVETIEVHNYLTNVLFIRHPIYRIIKSSSVLEFISWYHLAVKLKYNNN